MQKISNYQPNLLLLVLSVAISNTPVFAAAGDAGATGSTQGNTTDTTGYQSTEGTSTESTAPQGHTWYTGKQIQNQNEVGAPNLPSVSSPGAARGAPFLGLNGTGYSSNSLPPTTLDSFVYNSGYDDSIYGDEGTYGPPYYSNFSTIGSGMGSYTNLTTGHSSSLPSSWGYTTSDY